MVTVFMVILCSLSFTPAFGRPQKSSADENAWFANLYKSIDTTSTTPPPEGLSGYNRYSASFNAYGYGRYAYGYGQAQG